MYVSDVIKILRTYACIITVTTLWKHYRMSVIFVGMEF